MNIHSLLIPQNVAKQFIEIVTAIMEKGIGAMVK